MASTSRVTRRTNGADIASGSNAQPAKARFGSRVYTRFISLLSRVSFGFVKPKDTAATGAEKRFNKEMSNLNNRQWHYTFTYPKEDDGLVTAWAKRAPFPKDWTQESMMLEMMLLDESEREDVYFEYGSTTADAFQKLKASLPEEALKVTDRLQLVLSQTVKWLKLKTHHVFG